MRFLVVDDDAVIASFLVKGLREAGSWSNMRGAAAPRWMASHEAYDAAVKDVMSRTARGSGRSPGPARPSSPAV